MLCRFENNTIEIDIEVSSLLAPTELKKTITAKVDTGFTGDLQLTYDIAFPLGLTLKGFQPWTIADGTTVNFLECLGLVTFNENVVPTSIDVKSAGSILIGVSLLRKLGCNIKIDFVKNIAEINTAAVTVSSFPAQPHTSTKKKGIK